MRPRFLSFLSLIVAVFLIVEMQALYAGAAYVLPADRIPIEQPRYSGQWNAYDLAVGFSYSRNGRQMDISGIIRFASFWRLGFARLESFYFGVIFLDKNGMILEKTGLATDRGSFDPTRFNRRINLPPGAAFMAFDYQGQAAEIGNERGGGTTSFWYYPIH